MVTELSIRGFHSEFEWNLPWNNTLRMRVHVGTGLYNPDDAFVVQQNTHLWLLFCAASLLQHEGAAGAAVYELVQPWRSRSSSDFHDQLCLGLYDADRKAPYNDPLLPLEALPTWKSHFYDPDQGTNWLGETEPTAVSRGCQYYRQSQQAYRRGDLKQSGYNLGLALHYLTDLTQPMHAGNFTWLDSQNFGYHTDFERYVSRVWHRISPPQCYTPRLSATAPKAYFEGVARYTKDTYYQHICKPEWTQTYDEAARRDSVWEARVGKLLTPMLHDAIQTTAQFLLMWMKSLSNVSIFSIFQRQTQSEENHVSTVP